MLRKIALTLFLAIGSASVGAQISPGGGGGSGGSGNLTVGTSTIASGSSGNIEYNNGGVLGELSHIPNTNLTALTANQLLGAVSATTPSGLNVPSCSAAGNALLWTSGTGFGCASGYAPAANPTFTGSVTATGLITNADLANSTISGVALGSTLATLTFGTHLTASGSSYNGSTAVTILPDATNANTASTIVARDSSGNFSAGTITAALTGHASSDLALTGGTLTGKLTTLASASGGAGFNLPAGAAPTSPANGDLWSTSTGLFARVNGNTVGPMVPGAVINLKALGLPTGGDDTTAINNALASALPATFTATATLTGSEAYPISSTTSSGATLPFTNTTGIIAGMPVYWSDSTVIPYGTTVASVVANTSVTLSTSILNAIPAGSIIVFGPILTVTTAPGGTIALGDYIYSCCLANGTVISPSSAATGAGTGGTGIYNVTPFQPSQASATVTFQPPATASVYAPSGVYKHSGDIVIQGTCLFGDGPATNFLSTNTTGSSPTNALILWGNAPCLHDISVSTLWNSTRQGNNDSGAVNIGDSVIGAPANNAMVYNVTVNGSASAGIIEYFSYASLIRNNQIYNTAADGIIIGGTTAGPTFDDVIDGNYLYNVGDDCIAVDEYTSTLVYNEKIVNNYCENGQSRGITANGGSAITVANNMIVNPAQQGFQAGPSSGNIATSDVIFAHNQCINCGVNGAEILGLSGLLATNILFDGNIFSNVNGDCFLVGGGSNFEVDVSLVNNQCIGPTAGMTGNGIHLSGVTNIIIKDNIIKNVQGSGILSSTPFNTGYAIIEGNIFDKVGISSGKAINMASETLTSAIIRNNVLYDDGTTPAGFITLSGVAKAIVDGNYGDTATNSISGITSGYYNDAPTTYNRFGTTVGTFTCASGAATVSNTLVDATSLITMTLKTVGGTVAAPFVNTITAGTGFHVTCGGSDTSTYNYVINN